MPRQLPERQAGTGQGRRVHRGGPGTTTRGITNLTAAAAERKAEMAERQRQSLEHRTGTASRASTTRPRPTPQLAVSTRRCHSSRGTRANVPDRRSGSMLPKVHEAPRWPRSARQQVVRDLPGSKLFRSARQQAVQDLPGSKLFEPRCRRLDATPTTLVSIGIAGGSIKTKAGCVLPRGMDPVCISSLRHT